MGEKWLRVLHACRWELSCNLLLGTRLTSFRCHSNQIYWHFLLLINSRWGIVNSVCTRLWCRSILYHRIYIWTNRLITTFCELRIFYILNVMLCIVEVARVFQFWCLTLNTIKTSTSAWQFSIMNFWAFLEDLVLRLERHSYIACPIVLFRRCR